MGTGCTKTDHALEMNQRRIISPTIQNKSIKLDIDTRRSIIFPSEQLEFSFNELTTPRSGIHIKWKLGSLIGEGAYAKVYQCMNLETGELMAVKHFVLSDEPKKIERVFANMCKEVRLLKGFNHPNIVKYFQTDLSPSMDAIDILLEFVPGGSLKQLIQKYKALDESIIKIYSKQLLEGLDYLHQHSVVHRDLKSANVLITPKGTVKLTDFGSSRKFEDLEPNLTRSLKGSPYWMAPEVVLRKGHTYPADIWSFGCLVIEMTAGRPPWSELSRNSKEVLNLISTPNSYPKIPKCSESLKGLITCCLQREPSLRPTCKELLDHGFFN